MSVNSEVERAIGPSGPFFLTQWERLEYEREPREKWRPIETKPPFIECEERGVYTDAPGGGLFYFKATHWRPLSPAIHTPIENKGPSQS